MNAARAAVILVTICIIGPMLLGYCWPTSGEEQDQYAVSNGVDITDDIASDSVPVFAGYTGLFNHSFYYRANGNTIPDYVATTTVPGQLPAYDPNDDTVAATMSLAAGSLTKVSDLAWPDGMVRGSMTMDGNRLFLVGGFTASVITYFPATGQVVWTNGTEAGTLSADAVINTRLSTEATVNLYSAVLENEGTYADLSAGIRMDDGTWFNGFENKGFEMILDSSTIGTFCSIRPDNMAYRLALQVQDGTISADYNGDVRAVGYAATYPYIIVKYNVLTQTVTVAGLVGLDDFTDSTYTEVNPVVFDIGTTSETFGAVSMSGDVVGLVVSTEPKVGSRPGIIDDTIQPDGYFADGCWQIFIRDTAVFGSSLTLGANEYDVSRQGDVQMTFADGTTETVKVRDMVILSAVKDGERKVIVNSKVLYEGAVSSYPVGFGGAWMAQILLYDVDISERTVYGWEAGGFGLDMQGFCMAGLMFDIIAFIGLMLYGRGSGARVLPLLILCVMIGAVFFTLLMNF